MAKDLTIRLYGHWAYITFNNPEIIKQAEKILIKQSSFTPEGNIYLQQRGFAVEDYKLYSDAYKRYPVGLTNYLCNYLYNANITFDLIDKRNKVYFNEDLFDNMVDNLDIKLRDYQRDAVQAGLENNYGGFSMATGSGKSLIFGILSKAFPFKKVLLLVNRSSIAYQHVKFYKKILNDDKNIGFIGDGEYEDDKPITVAIVNSIFYQIEHNKELMQRWLSQMDCVIVDEYHHAASNMFKKTLTACKNTSHRWGFSATSFRKFDDDLYLEAFVGDMIYKITTSDLIERGWLADANIIIDRIKTTKHVTHTNWHKVYKKAIVECEPLNKKIIKWSKFLYERGFRFLIFVDQVAHGKKINDSLIENICSQRHVKFVNGKIDPKRREDIYDAFRNGDIRTLIVTSLGNEGLDFPEADAAINACGSDSPNVIVQRLGRILRKNKFGKSDIDPARKQDVYYIDFIHEQARMLYMHSMNRLGLYDKERAFNVIYY